MKRDAYFAVAAGIFMGGGSFGYVQAVRISLNPAHGRATQ